MTLKEIIKYRKIWMCFAILWVMLLHFEIKITGPLSFLQLSGYSGVDIFLFASGIGCYLSYSKDRDAAGFMKRRIRKLLPITAVAMAVWCVYLCLKRGADFSAVIGNLFYVRGFTGQTEGFNWYIEAIWVYYILVPYFAAVADKTKNNLACAGVCAVLVLFSTAFWNVDKMIIAASRLPVFFVGIYFAKRSKENDKPLSKKSILTLAAASAAALGAIIIFYLKFYDLLTPYGLGNYPLIVLAPAICIVISYVSKFIEKFSVGKTVLKALGFIGSHTLELYITHIMVLNWGRNIIEKYNITNTDAVWFASFVPIVLFSVILCYTGKGVLRLADKIKLKRENVESI